MFSTTVGGNFSQQLPYRQVMASSLKRVEEHVVNHIASQVKADQPVYKAAVNTLNSTPDGQRRLNDAIIGVVNYVDYLLNVANKPADQALNEATVQCIDGFVSNIVLRSPYANSLDNGVRAQLNQAEQLLGQAIQLVNQYIVPAIQSERQGGTGINTGGVFGNNQVRRSDPGFGSSLNQGGGPNLLAGSTNNGSIFSTGASAPETNSGGGISLGIDFVSQPEPVQQPIEFQSVTAQPQTKQIKSDNKVVIYMQYEQHKTHGLLKPVLPSDNKRSLMPIPTVDNNFAAMASLSQYTKLGSEVIRSDLAMPSAGAGYSIEQLILPPGQKDYSSAVNAEVADTLQLDRRELERLTFTGQLVQLYPEVDEEGKLKELLSRYNNGMMTHGRLTSMVAEMEGVLQPETIATISKKLAEFSSNYWRFSMQETAGEFTNYFEGHDAATEFLRREPNKTQAAEAWANFPAKVVHELFLSVPVQDGEGNEQAALGFQVGFIRVPYFAVELPMGVDNDDSEDYGVVIRNATPGLYHLCQTLYEGYPGTAHRCIMTNEGRLVEVIKPLIGDTDRFYIREMSNGLLP